MTVSNATEIVDVRGDALVDALAGVVDGTLYSVVEYDRVRLNVVYADEATLAFYQDRDHLIAHFEHIHSHVHGDFEQMELFVDDLFPVADRVEYVTTALEFMKLVRVYNEKNGLFVAIEPDEPVQPVVETIRSLRPA